MNHKFVFGFTSVLILIFGCDQKVDKKVVHVEPTLVIDKFNDTMHISQAVFKIETAFDNYFVPDGNGSRIYRIDSSLKLIEVIGRPGKGPGEFIMPMTLCFNAGSMYVGDAGEIKVFRREGDNWEYKKKYKTPPIGPVNENDCFLVRDSCIYFATSLDYWVTKYRLSDRSKLAAFGELFDLQPKKDRNIMQLMDFNNSFYVIGVSEAVIYRYNYEGQLISSKDFRQESLFLETTTVQNNYYNESSSNGLSAIFPASAIINGKIHVIFYERGKDESKYNRVLVIDPESLEITKIYELTEGGFYFAISPSLTSKNGFVAFNTRTASIELYDLD